MLTIFSRIVEQNIKPAFISFYKGMTIAYSQRQSARNCSKLYQQSDFEDYGGKTCESHPSNNHLLISTARMDAVSRANAELAEPFAREFGAKKWYAGWRELLTDAEVEAAYIATPVHLHAAQAIAAAEAGKHVLCEKPLAMIR